MKGRDPMHEVLIYVAIVSAAMLAGLMTALLVVFRPMWNRQSDAIVRSGFSDFLHYAGTNRVLSTLSILPVLCGIGLIFARSPETAPFVFGILGGAVFLVGFFLWTAFFNLPIYRAVGTWTDDTPPGEVRALIHRFHMVNIVRLGSALAATVLFMLAL